MTKEKDKQSSPLSFEKYAYGALAGRLLGSEESKGYAQSALEVMVGSKGLNMGEEALRFHRAFGPQSEDQMNSAINVYAGEFEKERGKYKPADMTAWYDSVLSDLAKEDKEKILGALGKYTETFETINKESSKAAYIMKGKDKDVFSKEQIDKAKKTLEKYKEILSVISVLDNYKFEQLRPDAVSEARKSDLKGLASKL